MIHDRQLLKVKESISFYFSLKLFREKTREQVFIGKQKDDLDGVAVPTLIKK